MIDFNKMTTEELTNNIEMLMRRFEESKDSKTQNILINTISKLENIRDEKSW